MEEPIGRAAVHNKLALSMAMPYNCIKQETQLKKEKFNLKMKNVNQIFIHTAWLRIFFYLARRPLTADLEEGNAS